MRNLPAIAVLASTCLIAALTGTPAQAQPDPARAAVVPSDGAIFNNPADPYRRDAITTHLTGLINGAGPGSAIRVALYQHELTSISAALTAANTRGVSVQVIVDYRTTQKKDGNGQWVPNPAYQQLADPAAGLGIDKTAPSWIMPCDPDGACIASTGSPIMHNKFFTFTATSGASNVVVQTSANMTTSQQRNAWNNAVTLTGNTALHNAYQSYFTDLAAKVKNPDYYRTGIAGNVKTYFFPRAKTAGAPSSDTATDTIHEILGTVTCTGGTIIRAGIFEWTRTEIARKLWELDNQGCQVQISYAQITSAAATELTKPGGAHGGPEARNSNNSYTDENDIRRPTANHSKYLIIAGHYLNNPNSKLVFTGSHNYTISALRENDEALLRIDHPTIHTQYNANFTEIWNNSPTTLHRTRTGAIEIGPKPPSWLTRQLGE